MRVVAAYIEDDGRCLLAERPAGKAQAGAWEFPGGKVEAGEDDAQALARELREEVGVEAKVGERLASARHVSESGRIIDLHLYRAEVVCGRPSGREGQRIRWQTLASVAEDTLCPADRSFLPMLLAGRGGSVSRSASQDHPKGGAGLGDDKPHLRK
ncbi:MAG: (deoxy)nucleoside triphosphate pyrophosphohydrolase [Myxococcota bacterium]